METKVCTKCAVDKPLEDYYKNGKNLHAYCKKCINSESLKRQRRTKVSAVEYKGGKCKVCGYDKCLAALQFHHLDPDRKDPNWKRFKTRTFDDRMKAELDKCILVCANCHAEIHDALMV